VFEILASDVEVVRHTRSGARRGRMHELEHCFAHHAVWHEPGDNVHSRDWVGWPAGYSFRAGNSTSRWRRLGTCQGLSEARRDDPIAAHLAVHRRARDPQGLCRELDV
jgi:hypothetical protein